jgi:4-amino-4-deoxy-L-arabinose transferase-like glycosyltransferase
MPVSPVKQPPLMLNQTIVTKAALQDIEGHRLFKFSIWQIWLIALAVKIILLPFLPLTPDEAYYFAWARHPALSYYDHPPFIASIMAAAYPLWKTALGIRLPGVILAHLGYVPWILILKKLNYSQRAQRFWILSLLLGPLTGLGSFIVTPDAPLTFFWSLSAWALLWVFEKQTLARWFFLGSLVGLGLLSKYGMVLFFPSLFLWLYWNGRLGVIKKPPIWSAAFVCMLVFLPVLIWNYNHDFVSFLFQLRHGLGKFEFHFVWALQYVLAQIGLINPIIFFVTAWYISKVPKQNSFLVALTIFPFCFFFLASFGAQAEGNWPICAYPSLMAIFASLADRPEYFEKARKWMKAGLYISGLSFVVIVSHTLHPWIPISEKYDRTRVTRENLRDLSRLEKYHPLFARNYQTAAIYSFYRAPEREVFKAKGFNRTDFYDFLPDSVPQPGNYVVKSADDVVPEYLTEKYELVEREGLLSGLAVYQLIEKKK